MIEIEAPDGSIVEFPEGTSDDVILGIMNREYGVQEPASVPAPQRTMNAYEKYGTIPMQAAQGALLGYGDEAIAPLAATWAALREQPSALFGAELRPELAEQVAQLPQSTRETMQRQMEEYPVTSTMSQVAGAITGGAGAAKAFPTIAAGVRSLPWWLQAPLVGTPTYAAYESGMAEPGKRAQAAVEAIPSGLGLSYLGGAAGQYIPKIAGSFYKGGKTLAERAAQRFGGAPQKTAQEIVEAQKAPLPVPDVPKAYQKVGKTLKKDFGKDLDVLLDEYKKGDISLSDLYGRRTTSLAEASALFPSGRDIAEEAIEGKVSGAYDRVLSSVRKNISGVDNYYTNAEDLMNAGRAKASPLYKQAFNANKSMQSTRLDRILSTPASRAALREVAEDTQNKMQLMASPIPELTDIAKDLANVNKMEKTTGGVSSGLKLRTLDAIKKNLDGKINILMDKKKRSGISPDEASTLDGLMATKNALLDEIDNLDVTAKAGPNSLKPEGGFYKQARAEAGDYLSIQSAMDNGRNALKTDPELIKNTFGSLSQSEKDAYKIGFGKAIRDELSKVREGANPFARLLKSTEQKAKAKAILSPQEYMDWEKSLRAEDDLFKFRNRVLGGSPTARREEAKELITSGAIDSIEGTPRRTFETAIKQIKTKYLGGINDNTAAKIADILYETDPVKKLQIVKNIAGDKALTKTERQTVQRAYSLMSPRYDVLYAPRPATGAIGATISQKENE